MNTLKTENIIARPMKDMRSYVIKFPYSFLCYKEVLGKMHIQFLNSHIFTLSKMESYNSQDFYERI